ncbi:basic proline-rich protein-like [Caloenas nicobarica]|uniref:basic proline-rich protein-like n=1 Tax=Caloenas nicobarica TaxID=187106 RepID=UPI0032B7B96E
MVTTARQQPKAGGWSQEKHPEPSWAVFVFLRGGTVSKYEANSVGSREGGPDTERDRLLPLPPNRILPGSPKGPVLPRLRGGSIAPPGLGRDARPQAGRKEAAKPGARTGSCGDAFERLPRGNGAQREPWSPPRPRARIRRGAGRCPVPSRGCPRALPARRAGARRSAAAPCRGRDTRGAGGRHGRAAERLGAARHGSAGTRLASLRGGSATASSPPRGAGLEPARSPAPPPPGPELGCAPVPLRSSPGPVPPSAGPARCRCGSPGGGTGRFSQRSRRGLTGPAPPRPARPPRSCPGAPVLLPAPLPPVLPRSPRCCPWSRYPGGCAGRGLRPSGRHRTRRAHRPARSRCPNLRLQRYPPPRPQGASCRVN